MTAITLATVWMNVAADPSDYRAFPLMSALNVTAAKRGEVRPMASGRTRLVLRAGSAKKGISVTLPELERTDVEWLEERVGQLLCVRDDRGRKVWATYLTHSAEENRGRSTGNVTLTLSEVSHEEVV